MPKSLPFREPADPDPLATLLAQEDADRRRLRRALVGAAIVHLGLLLVTVPRTFSEPPPAPPQKATVVLEDIVFERPKPEPVPTRPKPREAAATIPVPDLDPTEPEAPSVDEPEIELEVPELVTLLELPEAPADPAPSSDEPIAVGGDVVAPERLVAPSPSYTETARRARIQGDVVLQAVIDREGRVRDLEVVKGLPFGLTEQALSAVRGWRFRPATLGSEPVVVRYTLQVRFRLQ